MYVLYACRDHVTITNPRRWGEIATILEGYGSSDEEHPSTKADEQADEQASKRASDIKPEWPLCNRTFRTFQQLLKHTDAVRTAVKNSARIKHSHTTVRYVHHNLLTYSLTNLVNHNLALMNQAMNKVDHPPKFEQKCGIYTLSRSSNQIKAANQVSIFFLARCYHNLSFVSFSSFTLAPLHEFFIFGMPKTCQL